MRRLLLCAALLLPTTFAPPAQADTRPAEPPALPDIRQDEQQPERQQQLRLENTVGSPALKGRKNALMEQCWQMLESQSRNIGPVHVLSVNVIEEDHVFISGKFVEPDATMLPRTLPYECRVSADHSSIEDLSVGNAPVK